jgi:hypothetical protein
LFFGNKKSLAEAHLAPANNVPAALIGTDPFCVCRLCFLCVTACRVMTSGCATFAITKIEKLQMPGFIFFPQNVDNYLNYLIVNYFTVLIIFSTLWITECGKFKGA